MNLHTIRVNQIYFKNFIKTKQKFIFVNCEELATHVEVGDLLEVDIVGEHKPVYIDTYKNPFRITHLCYGDDRVINSDFICLGLKELK